VSGKVLYIYMYVFFEMHHVRYMVTWRMITEFILLKNQNNTILHFDIAVGSFDIIVLTILYEIENTLKQYFYIVLS